MVPYFGLYFYIFSNDLLFTSLKSIVCSFANDNQLFNCTVSTDDVIIKFLLILPSKYKPLKPENEGIERRK